MGVKLLIGQESCKQGLILALLQGNRQPTYEFCKLSLTFYLSVMFWNIWYFFFLSQFRLISGLRTIIWVKPSLNIDSLHPVMDALMLR